MSVLSEQSEALRLLRGLEGGLLTAADSYAIASKLDPVLVYFTLRYLREKYPASHPAGTGVATRLVELSSTYSDIVKKSKEGEKDSMREWFDDTYNMREYFDKDDEFVGMIVEKLES